MCAQAGGGGIGAAIKALLGAVAAEPLFIRVHVGDGRSEAVQVPCSHAPASGMATPPVMRLNAASNPDATTDAGAELPSHSVGWNRVRAHACAG